MPGLDRTWHVPALHTSFMRSDFPAASRSLSKTEEGQRNRMYPKDVQAAGGKGFAYVVQGSEPGLSMPAWGTV